jgi:lipid-A-disaccharide synthase
MNTTQGSKPLKIFFSVGEPSGDLHGANLIRALRSQHPGVECIGFGGPKMAAAGGKLHFDLTTLAVMWLLRVLLNLHIFWRLLNDAKRIFRDERPDAVVLIDYPGFNWHIARRAKRHGIPVFYYGTPQLWAWAGWRIKKMRRTVDHALCKLPFEEAWYRERGVNATHVGHPYFDELRGRRLDTDFVARETAKPGPLVAILPGSRTQEVRGNLDWLLKAAEEVQRQVPGARFAIASFKQSQAEIAAQMAKRRNVPVEIHVGRTPELIAAATCAMAVSGSVSLELLYHAKPTVILYHVSKFGFALQRFFRKVRYITLVNLLTAPQPFEGRASTYDPHDPADAHVLMPEYLTCDDRSADLARHAVQWLTDDDKRNKLVGQLEQLRDRVGQGGASLRAAEYMLQRLEEVDRSHDRGRAA